MKIRFLIPLAVFLVMTAFLAIGLKLDPREVPSPLIGKEAPKFSLTDVMDASKAMSTYDLKGDAVLVNVWASWCVSCRQEHPILIDLAKRGEVTIYGINYKDTREEAQKWLRSYGNPYHSSAFDPNGHTGIDWGVYGVPETFVLDKQGVIRHKHTGPLTQAVIEDELLPIIRKLRGEP